MDSKEGHTLLVRSFDCWTCLAGEYTEVLKESVDGFHVLCCRELHHQSFVRGYLQETGERLSFQPGVVVLQRFIRNNDGESSNGLK
jgi:hypothetical protein